jgi:hypothetical protein
VSKVKAASATARVLQAHRLPPEFPPHPIPREEPDELPVPAGDPPRHRLCPEGTPPIGLEFLGAEATVGGYLLPCPCCVQGWCLLLPDGQPYGYAVSLRHGCSRGCSAEDIAWWDAWRSMSLPREPVAPPDERARRYGAAVAGNELRRLVERPPADPLAGLRRAAFVAGQFLDSAGLDPAGVAGDLMRAARALGLDPAAVKAPLVHAAAAGRAEPRGVPDP